MSRIEKLKKSGRTLFTAIVSLLFAAAVFCGTYFEWLAYPEQLAQDLVYKSRKPLNNDIKIIGIDDYSIAQLGDYANWSRQLYADLLNILYSGETEPALVAFDVLFTFERDKEGDKAFADACKDKNIILASQLGLGQFSSFSLDGDKVISHTDPILAYDELAENTDMGYVDMIIDGDGFVRHSILEVCTKKGTYNSFAYKIAEAFAEANGETLKEPKLDAIGSILINFVAPPGSYEYIPLADVLSGDVPASVFEGSAVLVGSYADGMMDSYNVSVDRRTRMYGIEVNANITQTLLTGDYITHAPLLIVAIANGLFSGLLLFVTSRRKISVLSACSVFAVLAHAALCYFLWQSGILWYITYFIVSVLLVFVVNLIQKYVLERIQKEKELKALLYSMAEAMTEAIDQRTPYNASHTRKVSQYSVQLAEYVNLQHRRKRTKIHLTRNELDQLRLASLLHDVGKMSVPKNVLDKPTRLGGYLNDILNRFEKLELMIKLDAEKGDIERADADKKLSYIADAREFIIALDKKEWLSDEEKEKITGLEKASYTCPDGREIPLLNETELKCLRIQKGTLTAEEMELVHMHAVYTDGILERIRFGKNYQRVRKIASSHHELLDGKGYPNRMQGDEIDIPTRILTICDVYDALTADDRPYKKAKTVEQSLKILGFMAKDGQIDNELYSFAVELWGEKDNTPQGGNA